VHALSNASALAAAQAGVDVLAHTPVEPLDDATVAAWRGRAVISTLAAFGGSADAVHNLARLRAAGVTVLYGTDLGNTRDPGPSADEVKLLRAAGLDDAAITEAMTTAPLAFWGLSVGPAAGREATFVVLDGDPRRDASVLLHPRAVYVRGKRLH
jgi:imidazolonepropionase-like amidohydrolase